MKIGLLELKKTRGKIFPNLALMKIARFHRSNGDVVAWYDQRQTDWDKVYISKIFSYVSETEYNIQAKKIVRGGTGYYLNRSLPKAIENCLPDYSIYPDVDYAIGFLTRGCPNKCQYCVVPKKEGGIRPYSDWQRIKRADSKKIVFMDNNVLACDYAVRQMRSIAGADIRIDFNQGLDCLLVDRFIAKLLSRLKWIGYIRFACDIDFQMPALQRVAEMLAKNGVKSRRLFVYVLGTTLESTNEPCGIS